MRKLIIFIGPQRAGKTTQAILLKERLDSLGVKTRLTTLIHYAVFHLRFNRFVNTLCRDNKVMVKFYGDLPPHLVLTLRFTGDSSPYSSYCTF